MEKLFVVKFLSMATERKRQKLDKVVLPDLPKEVWCIIFAYLSKESRKNATSTCKLWFEIIRGDSRFSGNITIPWIELQNSSFDWDNWPSLKTIAITDESDDSSFTCPKMALEAMRKIDFKKCQTLEKVTLEVNFDVAELSRTMITTTTRSIETKTTTAITGEDKITETEKISTSRKYMRKFMKRIGTVLGLIFNPKSDIDSFKLEHLYKLEIHMKSQYIDNIERTLKIMKMIGEAAINLWWLIVGGDSFRYPEFFETGFKNFGTSLKVFTLKDDCFEGHANDDNDYVDSVHMFFKSLNESCPNLSILNLGCVDELGGCESNVEFERFFMAGFENVKELNVDFFRFTSLEDEVGHVYFGWFFGLINDCNNIETLSLIDLMCPFFGESSYGSKDMALITQKFKNLKKCLIVFNEEFERNLKSSCKEFASALAKNLDETFAARKTEFKVLIRASDIKDHDGNIKEEKSFQIIKMPFKNSIITRLDS